MKVQAIFEGNQTKLVLIAETTAEQRMLAVFMPGPVDAAVQIEHEGHDSYARIKKATVTLQAGAT
jgi:hypothetical protein